MIRAARPEDLEAVAAIEQATPSAAGWTLEQFQQELDSPRSYFAVAVDPGVSGYAVVMKVPPEAQLVDLAVAPGAWRRGLGGQLLRHLIERAESWGFDRMTLEVSAANEAALALYRRAGFSVVGRRKKFYNDGSDAILMDKSIP